VDQPDHDAALPVRIRITHREDAAALERCQDLIEAPRLAAADEQDVAIADLPHAAVALDAQRPPVDRLTPDDFVEPGTKGVFAENSNDERGVRTREGPCGPVHELCEVEEEDRLDLIFGRGGV